MNLTPPGGKTAVMKRKLMNKGNQWRNTHAMEDNIVCQTDTMTTDIVNFRQKRDSSKNKFNNFKALIYILILCVMNISSVRGWGERD